MMHSEGKHYSCPNCGVMLRKKDQLDNYDDMTHLVSMAYFYLNGRIEYICDECGFVYDDSTNNMRAEVYFGEFS